MVPEAPLATTDDGLVAAGDGWFVLNAREARWRHREGGGESLRFDGETRFPQVGINLFVLAPGEPIGMYHWEADQEDFLVLSGEAPCCWSRAKSARCGPGTSCTARRGRSTSSSGAEAAFASSSPSAHASTRPTPAGAATRWTRPRGAARRRGASADRETTDAEEAYARLPEPEPIRYREGWLPG